MKRVFCDVCRVESGNGDDEPVFLYGFDMIGVGIDNPSKVYRDLCVPCADKAKARYAAFVETLKRREDATA